LLGSNLLASFFHQFFELVDELYQRARAVFSARREYWNAIRNSFRMFMFNNWDEVLHRLATPTCLPVNLLIAPKNPSDIRSGNHRLLAAATPSAVPRATNGRSKRHDFNPTKKAARSLTGRST
jgi:hypothetical protein